MIELAELMAESVIKTVPSVSKWAKDKRYSQFGAELLAFYLDGKQVVRVGEQVVQHLETYVHRMGAHLESGNDPGALLVGRSAYFAIIEQNFLLERLSATYARLMPLILTVDPATAQALDKNFIPKDFMVHSLQQVMESGNLPIDSRGDIRHLVETRRNINELEVQPIPVNVPWERDVFVVINQYLAEASPRQQLAEIDSSLDQLREALLVNFQMKDLVIAVAKSHQL